MAELNPEVKNWSRKTVADGKWLDDNTIGPIKTHLERLYDAVPTNVVNGVKGANETNYRTGNVSISTTDIGAANASHTHGHISNDGKSTEESTSTTKYLRADGTWAQPPGREQVNADWNATSGKAEILNKPQNLVQDANYVHTDNNFTTDEKNKLAGIEAGANVNVQADWEEDNTSSDAYINHKPTIPAAANDATITIQGNGTAIDSFTVNASTNKEINITPSNIGAAATSHTHSAADITSGTLAVARGGTGEDTLQEAGNAIINALPEGSDDPVDNDYIIAQYANGGTTNTNFYRRKLSKLWNWILSKLSSSTARQASNGSAVGNRWTHTFVNPNGVITASDFSLQANISKATSGSATFVYSALDNGTWKNAFSVKTADLIKDMPYRIWGGVRGAVIENNNNVTYTVYHSNGTSFTLGPTATFSTHSSSNVHCGAALVVKLSDTEIYYCPCY